MEDPRASRRNTARWDIDRVRYQLDKPHAPRRDIRRIDGILKDVIEGLEEERCENLPVLRDAWPELVGSQIARQSRPTGLEHFVLTIGVDHPGWMPELERMKRMILQKMQSRYPDLRIRQLRLILLHR